MPLRGLLWVCPILAVACSARFLQGDAIEGCLVRTDFTGHDAGQRASIAWLIDYDRKVHETTCCALEPRYSVLQKRGDFGALKKELLGRIDRLEAGGDHEARAALSRNDRCYRALMDLYHDTAFATRPR